MLNAEQATKGCANHFQDAFSELYELQRRGMLCDITLFFESSREDSRQSTLDKDQQATCGSRAAITSTAQVAELENEENAGCVTDNIDRRHQLSEYDVRHELMHVGERDAAVVHDVRHELMHVGERDTAVVHDVRHELMHVGERDTAAVHDVRHELMHVGERDTAAVHDVRHELMHVGERDTAVVHAHKVVLAACSKVLQHQIAQDCNTSEMLVSAASYATVSAIIQFMYTGMLNLAPHSVDDIGAQCRAWHMQSAVDLCEQFQKHLNETDTKQIETMSRRMEVPATEPGETMSQQEDISSAGQTETVGIKIPATVRDSVLKQVDKPATELTETISRQMKIAATEPVDVPPTGRLDTPARRPRGRPAGSKSAASIKDSVRVTRTRSASLRSASPKAVKAVKATRPRRRQKKDRITPIDDPVAERAYLVKPEQGNTNALCDASERDMPDIDTGDDCLPDRVDDLKEKVEEKSHAYSLRPEIKRRRNPDDELPVKTRRICRNIVLENVLVIKGTRPRKNVHYTKTPAEIGEIHKHGYHADYLDLSLFSDTSEQQVKKESLAATARSKSDAGGSSSEETILVENDPGLPSLTITQQGSGDVATSLPPSLSHDSNVATSLPPSLSHDSNVATSIPPTLSHDSNVATSIPATLSHDSNVATCLPPTLSHDSQHWQESPEQVDCRKLDDKDHNYVVAQSDNLKQKGKQHGCRTCRRCHKRFRTKLLYRSHLDKCPVALSYPRKHYHCRQCDVSFATNTEYYKHRRMHVEMSKQRKPYMCNQCEFKCRVETRLVEHMYRQHGFPLENSGFEVYVCSVDGCGYQSVLRNVMKHHQTRHSQERPFMCEFCGTKFKSKVTLRTHTRIHTNDRMFKCTYCDSSYIQRVGLLNHVKSKHERSNEFLCSKCPFVTSLKPNLQNHMFSAHGVLPSDKAKVYKCEHCGLRTLRKSEYTNHMRRHSGVKSFGCDICSHKFYTQAEINNHKKRHLNNPPKHCCPYENCNFAVFEKSKLQQHIRIRHTEKGLKPWTCYICDYRTDLKGNLTKHLRTVHHLMVETNQKLCKVVSAAAATPHAGNDSLTPTGCVNVNDMHMSKMIQSVDVMPCQQPRADTVDVIEVPLGYVKVKDDCSLQTMSPSVEPQQHGMLVGADVNSVPIAILPDVSRPPDTSNMRIIYSMTNLAGVSPGVSCDDLVVMSHSVPNLAPLTSSSMSSLATTTVTSLTPLPSISSSLGHLRLPFPHTLSTSSSLALSPAVPFPLSTSSSLALSPAVTAPFPLSTSSSDTTTTLTPLVTHVPLPAQHILKEDGTPMLSALHMPTDPNSGFYMYADNQLIPSQALLWEHANQDITQYRQQAYK